ncbi:hypothetical protein ACFST9_24295 [Hymenobacter monticola]|uniref:Uncharacterized protein n=1 Tax=Hymenobacter monticola TaxID=1705399 RepID=A0ABY4B838_9BACT|nr:hypothetical protein [Hymenobacter monticola]UOE34904.1 hypothetical protein MTP16_04435 [Hymenobacter monticola]
MLAQGAWAQTRPVVVEGTSPARSAANQTTPPATPSPAEQPSGQSGSASADTTKKEVEKLRSDQAVLKAVVDSLRARLKSDTRDASDESHIATMSLHPKGSYPIYKRAANGDWQEVPDSVFKLTRMEFSTENGRITRANVYGKVLDSKGNELVKDVRFTNARTSLVLNKPVTSLNYLGVLGGANEYVRYSDLVQVTHMGSRRFLPDNENWELTPEKPSYDIHTGGGLGSLLEVGLFTDLLATLNNEPNALVTTEIASNLLLNPNPAWSNSHLFLFGAVRPFVSVARLDTRFDTLRTNRNGLIDRPALLQRNYLRFGANLNLLTLDGGGHVTWQLNTSWTRTIARVAGPLGTRDTLRSRNAYQNLYGFEVLATVRRQRNFGCDFFFTTLLHNVQSYQPPIANNEAQWVLRPGAQFYYYPFGSPSNKLFFRVTNFVFPKSRQRDFAQLQVGYSISLGALLPASANSPTPATRSLSSAVY